MILGQAYSKAIYNSRNEIQLIINSKRIIWTFNNFIIFLSTLFLNCAIIVKHLIHVTISRSRDDKIKIKVKKRLQITKEQSQDEIRSRTDNTMAERKRDRAK
jgi:hypothetical protein